MPDAVINRVNALSRDQPKQLIFTNIHGRPIGDVEVPGVNPSDVHHIEILVVDSLDVYNIEIPGVDVDIQEPQFIDIVDIDIPPTNPESIEVSQVHQVAVEVEPVPAIQHVETNIRRSSRVRTQTQKYTPSMSVPKYSYAVTQLEIQGVLNSEAHIFVQE